MLENGKTYFKSLVYLNRVPPIFFSWWGKLENRFYLRIEDLLVLTLKKTGCLEVVLQMYCFTVQQILPWSDNVLPQILPWSDNVLLCGNFSAELAKTKEKNRNTID